MHWLLSLELFLLALFSLLRNCSGTKCYTCQSDSKEGCFETQEVINCAKDELCVTMEYSDVIKKRGKIRRIKRYHKFCQHQKFKCNQNCFALYLGGQEQCEAACCNNDFCNKAPAKKKVVESKRRDTGSINNTSSSRMNSFSTKIVLGSLMILWLFIPH